MSESNYFRAIAIVRIVLKITWKILPGNLKILGFFYLKSLLRQCAGSQKRQGAGGKQQGAQKNDRALRPVVLA